MSIRSKSGRAGWRVKAAGRAGFRQRGTALLEILIAGSILSMCVISLYSAYSFGFGVIRLSQENVRADQILLQKMETLRVYPWSQTAPAAGIIPTNFPAHFITSPTAGGVAYSGNIVVTDHPVGESYSNTLRQLTVNLSWTSGGVPRSRSMTTFISQNGIQNL